MNTPALHHQRLTADAADQPPSRWLLTLHGAFGSGRNWATFMRQLLQRRPEWGAALVDLRAHGRTGPIGAPADATIDRAAADLDAVAHSLEGETAALLGHSLGGKIALAAAARPIAPRQVWIIDSTPAPREADSSAARMLRALRRLPDRFDSRDAAIEAVRSAGFSQPVAAWMATNLHRTGDHYRWRFDLDQIDALLHDFYTRDLWHLVDHPPEHTELHFVKAADSDILDEQAADRIERAGQQTGRVHLHRLPGGHWLHIDNPDQLVDLLAQHLE